MLRPTTLYTVKQEEVLTGGRGDLFEIAMLGENWRDDTIPVINPPDLEKFVFDYQKELPVELKTYPVEVFVSDGVCYYYILGPGVREIFNLREREYKTEIQNLKDALIQKDWKLKNMSLWERIKLVFKGY